MRSRLLRSIRTFFYGLDYTEVDTPVRVASPALEDYIDATPSGDQWLRTSPELHMKRLLAAGYERIFQIGSCFREGEFGNRHRPEFTMLEWYEAKADYRVILDQTQSLLRQVSQDLSLRVAYLAQEWQVLTVHEAFMKFTGKSVEEFIELGTFEEVLCLEIEPYLGVESPTVLIDYPSSMAALSKKKEENPLLAERWELYIDGLEIANAYSELTDADEQLMRFEETLSLRQRDGRESYSIDQKFMEALKKGMPESGGIAVGVDRLCMAFLEVDNISEVVFE